MAYRKIYIALDCQNDEEAKKMQQVAEEISAAFAMSAKDVLEVYPYVKKNAKLIRNSIRTLSQKGLKGIGSIAAEMVANFKK